MSIAPRSCGSSAGFEVSNIDSSSFGFDVCGLSESVLLAGCGLSTVPSITLASAFELSRVDSSALFCPPATFPSPPEVSSFVSALEGE